MKRIGLLSDTHDSVDSRIINFFNNVDEIWHAGDIGDISVYDELKKYKPIKAVYGNIDNHKLRLELPEIDIFLAENVKVVLTHIGGYPGRYPKEIKQLLQKEKPKLFICGHSHILKVIFDKQLNLLHINPGAAGKYGFHPVRTAVKFTIDDDTIKDLEIWEVKR
jgi:putative phosphoesterase